TTVPPIDADDDERTRVRICYVPCMYARNEILAVSFITFLAVFSGCGGGDDDDVPKDGGRITDGSTLQADAAAIMCGGANPSFPDFERACSQPSDCLIAFHQFNCCGSRVARGIAKDQISAFM